MTQQHTPGPWRLSKNGMPTVVAAGRFIADCNGPKDEQENMPNARLIAASPGFLAALQGIMAGIAGVQKDPVYEAARAAIAKATGEAA